MSKKDKCKICNKGPKDLMFCDNPLCFVHYINVTMDKPKDVCYTCWEKIGKKSLRVEKE